MKFKRILAVLLSALMLTSMASFTVSAQDDAELTADPILAYETATNQGKLNQNERGYSSKAYDAVNDIVFTHVVPAFDKKGSDNSIYINMYGLSTPVQTTAETEALYAVCYMRSNQKTAGAHAGFYGNISGAKSKETAYSGDEQWTKQVHTISIPEAKRGGNSNHFWVRPIGYNTVHKVEKVDGVDTIVGNAMAANAYYDVACVVLFETLEDAEAYDAVAKNALPGDVTVYFDAQITEDDDTDVYVEFPEELENGENVLLGWTADPNADEVVFYDPTNIPVPEEDVTYYAVWSEQRTYNFYKNDGTDEVENIVVGKGATIDAPTFTSGDKLFLGWSTTPDGEIVEIQKIAETSADYYAIWLDTYLTEIVIAGNDYDANTKSGALYGIDDLAMATELNIVMPYGWPTSIVPTVAAKSNNGDTVYTAPETFDGEGSVVAGDVTYKVTFTVADKDTVTDLYAIEKLSTVNNNGRGGYVIHGNTDKGISANKIIPIYTVDSEYYSEGKYIPTKSPSIEGWTLFGGAHFLESYAQFRALVYYDDGGDGADVDLEKMTPHVQISGAHTRGSLKGKNIFSANKYKTNRWEYIYFNIPADGYGYTLQTSVNFVDTNNASAFHNDVYYVAEIVALVDKDEKFLQYAPIHVESTNETSAKNDGTITGVTADMEIAIGDGDYAAITEFEGFNAEAGILANLAPDTYYVRYAADEKFAESEAVELTITPDSVEIYFDFGDNTVEQIYEYDADITVPAFVPAKAGYKFAGWALEGEDEAYDFEGAKATADLDEVTFVALWEKVTEFYVKGDATTAGDGMSAESPFMYFTDAWNALAGMDGTIYILGTTKLMGTLKGHGGNVVVTAGEEGAVLTNNGPTFSKGEGGSIKFENLEMRSSGQWTFINFQGLEYEFGEGVVVPTTKIDDVQYYTLRVRSGGEASYRYTGDDGNYYIDLPEKVVIRSGSIGSLYLGGKGPYINEDIYVEYYGGEGVSIATGNDSVANKTVQTDGGKLSNVRVLLEAAPTSLYVNWITEILGAYEVIGNNGVTTVPNLKNAANEELTPAGGLWVIHSGEGGRVDYTDEIGTYTITTDKTYIVITDEEGNETKYRAADGVTGNANLYGESVLELTLDAGKYTVSYSDEGVSVNGKFVTVGGEVAFALNAANDYSVEISDELVAWAEAHVEAVAGAGYKFSGEFASHDGKYETVDGVLTVEEYTDEVIELYPVAVEDDTLPFYHPVAVYDEKNGTVDVTVSITNGKFTAGTVGILYDADAVEFVGLEGTNDTSIDLTDATEIAKNVPENAAVAVWNAAYGSFDATATDVAVATFKFNVLDAEEVDGAFDYYVPTVEYDEYFDGVYYQASPVNAEGDDPYAVNYVDVYFGAFEFELAPTDPATITVKVTFADKAGATKDNITYLAYRKGFSNDCKFIALEEAGNEGDIEAVIEDVFFVGEKFEFTIVKNGYTGSESKIIEIADGMVIETTFVGGDIKESFTGDDENAVDIRDFGEGEVTLADFVRVVRGFDAEATDEYKAVVDINEDGVVNVTDISIVKANYGATFEDYELVVTYPTEG